MAFKYPETRRDDVVDDYHGVRVEDPYRWLENIQNSEVQNWIKKQNLMADTELGSYPGRNRVTRRTLELLEHETITYLVICEIPDGTRYFYLYKKPDINQAILCYQDGETGERKEIINKLLEYRNSIGVSEYENKLASHCQIGNGFVWLVFYNELLPPNLQGRCVPKYLMKY